MVVQFNLDDVVVEVMQKDIKNVHLSVHPPTGKVRISAPSYMSLDTVRVFAISKLDWIRQQQKQFQEQRRETFRDCVDGESHYVWGRRYLLEVSESDRAGVCLTHSRMLLQVHPGADRETKREIVEDWYRQQVKKAVPPLVARWEPLLGVSVARVFVRRMKTKWGSCNSASGSIRLNTDLAKKPRDCLEYVVVHEMVHLLEPTHSERFLSLLTAHYPSWREVRASLNELPLTAEVWNQHRFA